MTDAHPEHPERLAAARRDRDARLEAYAAERPGPTCPHDGKPLPPAKGTGRPRVWCSDACRRAAAREAAAIGRAIGADQATSPSTTAAAEPRHCPRCGNQLLADADPRRIWCSDLCRRKAGAERQAADAGAIAVRVEVVERERVVERQVEKIVETPVEHDISECVRRALASPAACRRILQALAQEARDDRLDDAKWSPVTDAARALVVALDAPPPGQTGWYTRRR